MLKLFFIQNIMTELEKIDTRIDRCIVRRNKLQDHITFLLRKLRQRELYLAELGRIKSKLATAQFELADDTQPKMKSKDKLNKYRAALIKFQKDSARATHDNTAQPIHKPTRADFEITRPEEIFIAERIEKEVTPKNQ